MNFGAPTSEDPHEGKLYGVHSAKIVDTDDPEDKARVKITLNNRDDLEERWARIVRSMAGDGFGVHFDPDEGTEVLVTFENGDVEAEPFVVGFLHNAEEKPPAEARSKMNKLDDLVMDQDPRPWMSLMPDNEIYETSIHTISTQTGSKIVFKESESFIDKKLQEAPYLSSGDWENSSAIVVKTQGGRKVVLDDLAGKVHLEDRYGNSVTMDRDGISLKSEEQWNIPIPDLPFLGIPDFTIPNLIPPLTTGGTISLEADDIQINGTNIDINGTDTSVTGANLNLRGGNTTMSGVRTNISSTLSTTLSSSLTTNIQSGGSTSITAGGAISSKCVGAYSVTAGGGMTQKCGGALSFTSGGALSAKAGGALSLTTLGALSAKSAGATSFTAGGALSAKSGGALSLTSGGALSAKSGGATSLTSGGALSAKSGGALSLTSGGALSAKSGGALSLTSGAMLSAKAGAMFQATAPMIMLN